MVITTAEEKKKRTYKKSENYYKNHKSNIPTVMANQQIANLPEGTNTRYIEHLIRIQNIAVGSDRKDVEGLKDRFVQYLHMCAENDYKVNNMAAYAAMGVGKDDIYRWEHGIRGTPEHKKLASMVKSICGAYRSILMDEGEINPVVGIFWQKCFDGLSETAEADASLLMNGDDKSDTMTAEDIMEKYDNLPD